MHNQIAKLTKIPFQRRRLDESSPDRLPRRRLHQRELREHGDTGLGHNKPLHSDSGPAVDDGRGLLADGPGGRQHSGRDADDPGRAGTRQVPPVLALAQGDAHTEEPHAALHLRDRRGYLCLPGVRAHGYQCELRCDFVPTDISFFSHLIVRFLGNISP